MARTVENDTTESRPLKSAGSRYASKKAYFARNKDGAISNRNRDRRLARAKRRAAYWASADGVARKARKMNTPEKLEKRDAWYKARDVRRRERKQAEQRGESVPQA